MKDDLYPEANTLVCIEDSKLLKRFQYDILFNAKGLAEALSELNDLNYFKTYENANPDNFRTLLNGLMKRTFDFLREITQNELAWRIFSLYYDIHNMKLVVKEKHLSKKLDSLSLSYGSYSMRTIRSAAVNETDNILQNETLTEGFFQALRSDDIYDIGFILDRTYFRVLKEMAEKFGISEISDFVTEKIDLYNLSAWLQAYAEGGPEGYFEKTFSDRGSYAFEQWLEYADFKEPERIAKFPLWQRYSAVWAGAEDKREIFYRLDVLVDNYLINKTKVCKIMAFGIEPICAYFFNKFIEIKNVRVLLKGKESGYDTDEIKKRMRIPYEL